MAIKPDKTRRRGWKLVSTWWRASPLRYERDPYSVDRWAREQAAAYVNWLAAARGWEPRQASRHVEEQREHLARVQRAALAALHGRLWLRGLRPLRYPHGGECRSFWRDPAAPAGECVQIGETRRGMPRDWNWKIAHSIVIKPGRAPGDLELDMIAGEAVEALASRDMFAA